MKALLTFALALLGINSVRAQQINGIPTNVTAAPTAATGAGSANTMTACSTPSITVLVANQSIVRVTPNAANTSTTPTFNWCSLGAATVVKASGGAYIALAVNDYTTTVPAEMLWTGTYWDLLNPQTGSIGVNNFSGDGTLISNVSSNGNVTATLANAGAHTVWGNMGGSSGAPSYNAVQGTDSKVLSSGTISGTGSSLCIDANGGATTTGCSGGTLSQLISVDSYETGNRSFGTVYQNTGSFPMFVVAEDNSGAAVTCVSDSASSPTTLVWSNTSGQSGGSPVTCLVLPSNYYKLTGGTVRQWHEFPFNYGTLTQSADLVGSRVLGTTYQNTSSNMIFVEAVVSGTTGNTTCYGEVGPTTGLADNEIRVSTSSSTCSAFLIVPAGWYYQVHEVTGSVQHWFEFTSTLSATVSANLISTPATRTFTTSASSNGYFNVASQKTKFVFGAVSGGINTLYMMMNDSAQANIEEMSNATNGDRSVWGVVPFGYAYYFWSPLTSTDEWYEVTVY